MPSFGTYHPFGYHPFGWFSFSSLGSRGHLLKVGAVSADQAAVHTLLARARLRAGSESGITLVELLVTMTILLTVLVAVTDVLISGTHSETNVEHRLNTQAEARLALTKMRQDVHCAYAVQSVDYDSTNQGFTLSLTEFYNTCKAVDSSGSSSSKVQLLWCTVPVIGGSTSVYNLYRGNTTCSSSSTLVATNIVAPAGGWPTNSLAQLGDVLERQHLADAGTCTTDYLQTLPVDLAVNSDQTGNPERLVRAEGLDRAPQLHALRHDERRHERHPGAPDPELLGAGGHDREYHDANFVDRCHAHRHQQSLVSDHDLSDDCPVGDGAVDLHGRKLDDRRHCVRLGGRQLQSERQRLQPRCYDRQLLVVCRVRGGHE